MPLVGGQGGLWPTRNLGVQFTLFKPGRADYTHHITACPPGFENLAAALLCISNFCPVTHCSLPESKVIPDFGGAFLIGAVYVIF